MSLRIIHHPSQRIKNHSNASALQQPLRAPKKKQNKNTHKNSWSWFSSSLQSNWADEKVRYNHKIDVPPCEQISHQSPVPQRRGSPWKPAGGSPPCFSHLLCAIHLVQGVTRVISKPDNNPNKAKTILLVYTPLRKVEPHPKVQQPVRKELRVIQTCQAACRLPGISPLSSGQAFVPTWTLLSNAGLSQWQSWYLAPAFQLHRKIRTSGKEAPLLSGSGPTLYSLEWKRESTQEWKVRDCTNQMTEIIWVI